MKMLATLMLACLLATSAGAQDPTGTIEGRVTDNTAAALPGAVVVTTHVDTGIAKEAVTGEDGFFRVPLLPVGRYRVRSRRRSSRARAGAGAGQRQRDRPPQCSSSCRITETVTVRGRRGAGGHRRPTRWAGWSPGASWSTCR